MRTIISLILFVISTNIFAQPHPITQAKTEVDLFQRFDNFTTKNGLPSNYVTKIFQDNDGFIWLATDNGLSRYDGQNFTNFQPVDGDSTSISSRLITSIAQDKEGFLWIGTENGLNKFDPINGTFKQYNKENSTILKDNHIRALLVCSDGFLWIDCANATLTQLNTKNLNPVFYSRQGKAFTSYVNHTIYETKNKEIWAGGNGIPTIVINKENSSLTIVRDTVINFNKCIFNPISDIYEDEDGFLWVGNTNAYLSVNNLKEQKYSLIKKHPCTYAVCADKNGCIWLGGYGGGAARYNKKQNLSTYYLYNPNQPNSICGTQTFDIFCDKSGVVWFATDQGLSKFSYYKYKFSLYRHIPETKSPISNRITAIYQDTDDDIILGTQDAGFAIYNPSKDSLSHYVFKRGDPKTVGSDYITAIDQDRDGLLWFSLWNGDNCSLTSFDKKTQKFKRYRTIDDYNWYFDVECAPNGDIIGASWGSGVVFLNKTIGNLYKKIPLPISGLPLLNNETKSIVCDKSNNLWVESGFLNAYNTKTQKVSLYVPKYYKNKIGELEVKFLPKKIVDATLGENYLFTDTKNNLWLINKESVIQYLYETDNFVEYTINTLINPKSVSNKKDETGFWIGGSNSIYSFSAKSKKIDKCIGLAGLGDINLIGEIDTNCLVISSSTGLHRITLSNNGKALKSSTKISTTLFSSYVQLGNGSVLLGGDQGLYLLKNNLTEIDKINTQDEISVHSIFKSISKDIYIGTNKGLVQYKENEGITKLWKFDPYTQNQLQGSRVVSITQNSDESIWVLTDVCVATLNPDNKTFTNFIKPANTDISGNLITVLLPDSKGNLWVGTSNGQGLNRVNQKNGLVDHFINLLWDSTSIKKVDIFDIFESSDSTIWIATSGGLSRFNEKTMNFTHFDKRIGFISETLMSINEDKKGNLWLGTTGGLSCFNPKTLQCINYTWKDGVQEGEFSKGASLKLKNGQLIIGGMEGFNIFYPDSIKQNPYLPNPTITKIKVNGTVKHISNPKHLNLKYSERNIEISFSSNDYNFQENNAIKYKLDGFDDDFTIANTNSAATYTNLSPGNYKFTILSSNNDKIWCTNPLVLNIKISYPFWLKWWAIIIEMALFVGFIILIVRIKTQLVIKQKELLEKEVASRTELVMAKNEEIIVQRDILSKQKDHIHKIHNQISDSIEYAQHLQNSTYLSKEQRDDILGDNFLLYLPKDKVGGDFCWAHKENEKVIFTVVDCTGHGVPGALMSMIGLTALKEISQSINGLEPCKALSLLHYRVTSALTPSSSNSSMLAAMDIGYCVMDKSTNKLKFSGGHIDVFIAKRINNNKSIIEIKGDNKRVGNALQGNIFKENEIDIAEGDFIYLFSDGLADQFDSEKNEKFSKRRIRELVEFISDFPFEVQSSLILSRLYEWKGEKEQTDDITVLGIKV